jgi:glycosyltransferase involved in cell wall biosynthesis
MSARANVHFLGPKTTAELARYPQHFQACLMPYRIDEYTKFIYPLKLHEYLASGAPVVGSRLPTLDHFDHVVSLAQGSEQWSGAIAQALTPAQNSVAARQARQAVARAHDWSAIVGRIAAVLGARLGFHVPGGPQNGFHPAAAREHSPELPLFQ